MASGPKIPYLEIPKKHPYKEGMSPQTAGKINAEQLGGVKRKYNIQTIKPGDLVRGREKQRVVPLA